jgi:PAS domain S-box-containing protein
VLENLEPDVLETLLDTLPVEVSFIDDRDEVRYFNKNGERIFPRPRSIIGRKVQQCHPQKSLHKVTQILDAFKRGKRDVAEFWINLKGRQIHIRYFPVRDKKGVYRGTLEVTQDITDIKKIEGEKRLLDWT